MLCWLSWFCWRPGAAAGDGSGAGSEASTQAAAGEIGEDSNASAEQAPEGNGTGGTASGEAGSGILQAADPNRKLVKTQTARNGDYGVRRVYCLGAGKHSEGRGIYRKCQCVRKETGGTALPACQLRSADPGNRAGYLYGRTEDRRKCALLYGICGGPSP